MSIEDDVVEVNNDFVYNKFKEKVQTADNVIFKESADGTIELLVIKRKRGPHRDLFALPGGILDVSLSKEQMIQGVVDPGAPSFRATEVHDFLMPFQSDVVLDITDKYRANEVFGAEALREALEEVDLKRKFIKNSFYLPIKYDRFDWDARAAGGVDVGGIGIIIKDVTQSDLVDGQPTTSVVEEWIPKAKDDAIAYEWIKLDDVISGEKQLAFGHVEFVRDALSTSMKKDLLNKSNKISMLKGNSVYTYYDLDLLDEQIYKTSQRNSKIIAKANVVRKQNNQPLIPTENIDSIVDRKNRAFIDSIRGLRSYTSNSRNPVKFTAQMQMEPDFIFSELFGDLTDQALYALKLTDSDFVGFEDLVEVLDDENNLYRETGEALAADSIELSPSGKRKVKAEIKDFLSKNYKMKLKSKINQGMLIGDYIAAMANNADQIIKSKDFNLILDNLLDSGLKIEIAPNRLREVTPDDSVISVLDWGSGDLAEYVKLDDRNTIISEMGLSAAVDDNFAYLQSAYGDDIIKAMENIRAKNNRFFARTFPPEIYIPSWDYFKDNAVAMPEAMLETKKLKLTGDNRLQGMVYHGSPGLNSKGRAVNQILQNRLLPISTTSPSVVGQYQNSMRGLINKISTENNLNFLDARKFRGQNMLVLNYMYTTSNPFLATSYSMGGLNDTSIELLNSNAHDAFHTILNHTDVLEPDDVDTLNLIKEDLKRLGLSIQEQNGSLRIVDVDTGMRPQLSDPIVMQVEFDVPSNAILHADMPITRQLKNPNVTKFLQNVLINLQADNMLDETIVDDLIKNLMEVMRRDEINAVGYLDETMSSNVTAQLQTAIDDPDRAGAATRKTIKDYYIRSLADKQEIYKNKINTVVGDDAGSLRTLNEFLPQYLYAKEAISQQGLDDAFAYVNSFGDNLIRPTYFVNQKNTAGHVLFTKNLNDTFANVKRINFDVALNFANNLPIESLGGSYSATRDLLYLQKFMEVVRPDTEVFMDFIEFHKNHVGYKQIIKNMVQNKIEPTEDLLFDLANSARGYTSTNDVRVKSKYNIDLLKEVKNRTANLNTEVDDIVFSLNKNVEGDKTLINFLNRMNGLPQKHVEAIPRGGEFIDKLLLKSLAQSGIEIVAGTGGGRADALAYHDVFGIVDPGDKFGTGIPREAKFKIKSVELNEDRTRFLNDLILGNRSLSDLADDEIRAIAEIIPIETVTNNETLSQTTKDRWSKLYKDLNIYDDRFVKAPENIAPRPLDGVFLQEFDDLRKMIAQQSIFGDVDDLAVQKQVTQVMKTLEGQVDPKDFTRMVSSTGLTSTLANGLDMFDAAVILPVALDIVMSKRSGIGSETETIGGAVADVAGDIYDPSDRDTSFEALYGSPADPDSIAGQFGAALGAGKKALSYVFNPNGYLDNFIGDIKEVAIKALEGVRDAAGLNDWVYNVKRDMYVTQKLKQDGYGDGQKIPSGRVKELENEYETAIPNDTDRFGVPLDTSFGDYIKDSFKVNPDFKLVGDK